MLKYKVFANQITSLADARYFAAHGVEWLNFLMTPGHPSFISPQDLVEIKNWISGPKIVGSFIQPTRDELIQSIESVGLDVVVIDSSTSLEVVQQGLAVPVLKAIDLDEEQNLEQTIEWAAPFVDGFIVTSKHSILEQSQDISQLKELCQIYDILLDIKIVGGDFQKPKAVMDVFEQLDPRAMVLDSIGQEQAIGMKSFDELDSFFDYLSEDV